MGLGSSRERRSRLLQRPGAQPMQYGDVEGAEVRGAVKLTPPSSSRICPERDYVKFLSFFYSTFLAKVLVEAIMNA